jgi:Mg-chelatase subunit ChlD
LADLTAATDRRLRQLARQLAGKLMLDIARRGPSGRAGVGRMTTTRFDGEGDLDVDASIEPIIESRRAGGTVDIERLRTRRWTKPSTAICLVVDRSGSMGGESLATAALASAAIALRVPGDYSVIVFGRDVVVAKSQDADKPAELVVDAVLSLRGFGTTDVAGALLAAAQQLGRSRAQRKIALLLSDCRSTVEGDSVAAAAALDELCIVAPADDCDDARQLAEAASVRWVTVSGPSGIPAAIADVLDRS